MELVEYVLTKKERESIHGMYRIPGAPYGTLYTFIISGNANYVLGCAVHEAHMLTNLVAVLCHQVY